MSAQALSNHISKDRVAYPLPSTEQERERLTDQASFVRPITQRLLEKAGLRRGMHVLDVGSGAGDVALLAREMVGDAGSVTGYDRDPDQVAHAQARAERAGFKNVSFICASTEAFESPRQFDIAVGRFTLMYHPSIDAALTAIARHVRPGGVLAFHEMYFGQPAGWPPIWPPVEDAAWSDKMNTMIRTMAASGVNIHAGAAMIESLVRLGETHAVAEQGVMFGPDGAEGPLALLKATLPKAEALGLISPGAIDVDAMRQHARDHARSCMPVSISPTQMLAWTKLYA